MTNTLVLMAAFNGEFFIAKQLQSLLRQTYRPKKIVINNFNLRVYF